MQSTAETDWNIIRLAGNKGIYDSNFDLMMVQEEQSDNDSFNNISSEVHKCLN